MRYFKHFASTVLIIAGAIGYPFHQASVASAISNHSAPWLSRADDSKGGRETTSLFPGLATQRYRLDASQSKFIAHALRGGLLWFKGHDHLVAVRDFTGEAQMTPDSITPASLEIIAKAGSMVETNSVFTDQQKQIIDKELREIVLQPDKYPDITFRSTSVAGKTAGANQYDLKIVGDLTLHGVTRQITIPTHITVTGNDLRAHGEFSVNRDDFKVKATSAAHGMVRVRNKIKFTFDIVGHSI